MYQSTASQTTLIVGEEADIWSKTDARERLLCREEPWENDWLMRAMQESVTSCSPHIHVYPYCTLCFSAAVRQEKDARQASVQENGGCKSSLTSDPLWQGRSLSVPCSFFSIIVVIDWTAAVVRGLEARLCAVVCTHSMTLWLPLWVNNANMFLVSNQN